MQIDLSDKTALVTASTAGIGLAIATGLARAGASVVINGRSQESVERAIGAIGVQVPGARLRGVPADVGTAAGCAALVAAVPAVDILVNNAGVYGLKDFFDLGDEDWTHIFEMNVMSGVRLSRAYLPGMTRQQWGRVVFISSESALNVPEDMIHYGFSKTSQLSISRGLAKRLRGTGITVNAVLPGPTLSDGLRGMLEGPAAEAGVSVEAVAADFIKAHRPSSILQRAATVEEVANMVVYVCSRQASATTGAALRVDGGVVDTIA
ncbi:SDR family oxidoreductase [Cupriavidus basilensis]|uniref:SDR family oxidoreductase n=1 Tax=Cupriavidus basilensis TaxID=68895 RepID=A0ABT6AP24_9BURK|nr:SDR family oxidoreductase [Cupriavidus basilensis]MDF3834332.1 SDR family oxidoreductase [Cupriavidus basilensis]